MGDLLEAVFKKNNRGLLSARVGTDVFVLTKKFQVEGRYEFIKHQQTGKTELLTFYSCLSARFIV